MRLTIAVIRTSALHENMEHHRYSSFRRLLDRDVLDDLMLERFIDLRSWMRIEQWRNPRLRIWCDTPV
jgi:hypothetical protein